MVIKMMHSGAKSELSSRLEFRCLAPRASGPLRCGSNYIYTRNDLIQRSLRSGCLANEPRGDWGEKREKTACPKTMLYLLPSPFSDLTAVVSSRAIRSVKMKTNQRGTHTTLTVRWQQHVKIQLSQRREKEHRIRKA